MNDSEPKPLAQPAQPTGPAPKQRSIWGVAVGALAIGAIIGGASGAGVAAAVFSGQGAAPSPAAGPSTITVNDPDDASLVTAVAARAIDSVVTVAVEAPSIGTGTGSGVVVDDEGHIVTNSHVVSLGGLTADPRIRVTTSGGRVYDATVVGVDPILDLAVIKVEGASLPAIEFGDSDSLNVGDLTIAIGAPLGLAGTVTSGIVSSLDRSVSVQSSAVPGEPEQEDTPEEESDPFDFFNFDIPGIQQQAPATGFVHLPVIQTDTAINQGNSGGALLDSAGRLIGINVAIATGNSGATGNIGVAFAIPSRIVERVAGELIANGTASHGLLGANVANVGEDPAQTDAVVIGASVVELVPGGAAERAGLRVGDIVIALAGVPITNKTDLTAQVRSHAAGDSVELIYVRGDRTETVEVELGSLGG